MTGDEPGADFTDRWAIVLAEVGDRLVVRRQAAGQPEPCSAPNAARERRSANLYEFANWPRFKMLVTVSMYASPILIVRLAGDDMTDATSRVVNIAFVSWYHMNMRMLDCLPSDLSTVRTNVECAG